MNIEKKTGVAVIAGAGPAGLTAAEELLGRTEIKPIVFEKSDNIGGISRTVNHNGNRMDIGGHRFFSKLQRVNEFWNRFMPSDANPELTDRVMLRRPRVSRIFYLRKFFDYPISLKFRTFANMGFGRTVRAGLGFVASMIRKRPDDSLENFYINRFGKPLYKMFFEDYTEKVWGVHPSKLGADWGSQRVKGLSLWSVVKDMLSKSLGVKGRGKVETSLIEEFIYPKYGPGQLWETVAEDIVDSGGEVNRNSDVVAVNVEARRVVSVDVRREDGTIETVACDYFFSTMPIKELVASLRGVKVPDDVMNIALTLPYRDFITVGLLVDRLAVSNSDGSRIPDTWIYIQERDVKIGRLQIFNNWSPYMVADDKNTVWIGLEYFCSEGDELWKMSEKDFIEMARKELVSIGIINEGDVKDSVHVKVKKAYPSYFGSYYQLDKVRDFLDTIPNLWCLGRNGQHRYNNMDHSMLTAMKAVDSIVAGSGDDKCEVWAVNTEEEYHESK